MKTPVATRIISVAALILAMIGEAIPASAAPVSPETARQEAAAFLSVASSNHLRRSAAASPDRLTLAYTSEKDDTTCFYIFNMEDGFVIVSADDRLPAVLGYSDKGAFDYEKIPENMKWWLSQYDNEISHWLPSAPDVTPGKRTVPRASQRTPIAPLTTTTWDQGSPYNNLCPLDASGQRSVTGCVATAMAQILKFHNWPDKPQGTANGMTLTGTTYNWRNMLDSYSGNYSSAQANAVATLMRQCGASVNMMYSSYSSGAYDKDVQTALFTNFKYDKGVRMTWKDYTPMTQWLTLVYDELAAGRPVYYSGSSSQGGHAFVCDGYDENDYFHFNWGWGGYQDGYFKLTALNPASGGAGSYEAGYNSRQMVMTNIVPDKNGTSTDADLQCLLLATGGFYYDSGTTFVIKQSGDQPDLIYNPLGYPQTVYIGLKIVNVADPNATPVYVNSGDKATVNSLYGSPGFSTPALPSLPDGRYKISCVYSPASKIDWKDLPIPIGKQNYVDLTVTGGNLSFSNNGPDPDSQANLIIGIPQSTSKIYGNTNMVFKIPVLNVGQGDFVGQIGIDLMDADNEFGDAASYMEQITVPGKSYQEIEAVIDYPVAAARYNVSILDDSGNYYLSDYKVTTTDGKFPAKANDGKVSVYGLSPSFMESDKENPIYFSVTNNSILPQDMVFRFIILDATTLAQVSVLPMTYTLKVPASYEGRVNVRPTDLELQPGEYMWYVADSSNQALSDPVPLIITSSIRKNDGVAYIVTSEKDKEALLVSPESGAYSGSVSVPESVDGYTLTAMRNDAFTFSTAESVSLPATITSLPDGAFYNAAYLKNLYLDYRGIVSVTPKTFDSRLIGNYWLNVRNSLANAYPKYNIWKDFNMTHWQFELSGGVEVASGLIIDTETSAPYSPYYVNYNQPVDITFEAPAGMNVRVEARINDILVDTKVINPLTTSFRLPRLGLMGIGSITASSTFDEEAGVESLYNEADSFYIYSVDGRVISTNASPDALSSLQPGIYIINGKKISIR